MSTYVFVSGDTGSVLRVACKNDSDSSIIDLTGGTVALRWKDLSGILQSKTMTLVGAATLGVVQYQFAAGELFAPLMSFEIQITDSLTKVIKSLSLINCNVRDALV